MDADKRERHLAAQRRWRANNSERALAGVKEYQRRNREQVLQRKRERYSLNRDRMRREANARHAKNPHLHRERSMAYAQENAAAVAERKLRYARATQEMVNARTAKRRAIKIMAAVAWADPQAIAEIYREAARRTKATGVKHHVDHIYPLNIPTVCGLHVQGNLQVLPAKENIVKANKMPLMECAA